MAKKLLWTDTSFKNFDTNVLSIKTCSDAALACIDDYFFQIHFVIIMSDRFSNINLLEYLSNNSKWVPCSVMGAKVYAFADVFDRSFIIRKDIEKLLTENIPLHLLIDSKPLFRSITKGQGTTQKFFLIDILAARQLYKTFDISQAEIIVLLTILWMPWSHWNISMLCENCSGLE